MEELLNKLIEKGWKPFGNCNRFDFRDLWLYYFANEDGRWSKYPLRMLVSRESGLWQFVCENEMVEYDTESWWGEFSFRTDYINWFYWKHIFENNYQYRLIECALTDEDKLEDFILSNITL